MTRGEYLTLTSPKSFIDLYSFGMVKHVNGYYTSYKNSFTPSCELGINSKSAQAELAKEFLRLVLSEEIQTNDLYDGFPLNSKALIASSSQDRSSYSAAASVTNEDGSETMIVFEALDQKQIKDLVDICSSVSDKVTSDEHITAVIKEKAGEFFRGKLSAEALADAIIEKLNVYLSE
jgi:ABC-type glycerol-3-phosphate transport system substrate-binding protein